LKNVPQIAADNNMPVNYDADEADLLRLHEFGLTFNCIDDVELLALTGCTREVLYAAWLKYGDLVGSPIRRPYVCGCYIILSCLQSYFCFTLRIVSEFIYSRSCGGAKHIRFSGTHGDLCLPTSILIALAGVVDLCIAYASAS
jgi:hypothetical protein